MRNYYTVKTNDSLSLIARDEIGDIDRWTELAYINSIDPPYIIYPGQRLLMPSDEGLEIVVRSGQAPPLQAALFSFNPATVTFLVVGGALLYWYDNQDWF